MGTITFLCCCFEKPGDGIIDNERHLNKFFRLQNSNQNCIIVLYNNSIQLRDFTIVLLLEHDVIWEVLSWWYLGLSYFNLVNSLGNTIFKWILEKTGWRWIFLVSFNQWTSRKGKVHFSLILKKKKNRCENRCLYIKVLKRLLQL